MPSLGNLCEFPDTIAKRDIRSSGSLFLWMPVRDVIYNEVHYPELWSNGKEQTRKS
jgi:hypothetical protein